MCSHNEALTMNKWVIVLISLLVCGCSMQGSKTISYYHFDVAKSETIVHTKFNKPRLEIMPVVMPEYLNARGVAQRINQHRTVNANWHLWASQPGTMLDRAALNQLEKNLPLWFVVSAEEPWLIDNRQAPGKIVKLQFKLERFNGGIDNDAELVGSWTIFDQSDHLLMRQNFTENVRLKKDGYEGLAAALQQGWEKICNEVAVQLNERRAQVD